MVTLAPQNTEWNRASYLDAEAVRGPQAIGDLMEQLLSRYSQRATIQPVTSSAEQPLQSCGSNQGLGSTL